ncbi:tRNA pseudouridine synthase A isoform X2 [Cephus cinctus]|uniref:Pseudouridylate synthase 1 homolog n=1 Tax=Cephus cinctus TaxID=211228 RepID=A0AAJ7FMA7_CEPCN|nr:tRNA pseudouridine synthase A isoform X2 [Cephus cinctus]
MLRLIKHCGFFNNLCSYCSTQHCKMSLNIGKVTMEDSIVSEQNNKRPLVEENDENLLKKQKTVSTERVKKKNYAILLGYLGKGYFGMQRNPGMKTIEEDLINALFKANLINEEAFKTIQTIQFQRAARTDKGVSAARQIVSLKLPEQVSKDDINIFLPNEIRIFGIKRVTKGFNSKTQCDARTYTYTLPTYAFAPEPPNILQDEEYIVLEERLEKLSIIDGKPFNEYRISTETVERIKSVLKMYEGTHNFHNFTSKVKPLDPRAKRYIMECTCSEPFISKDMQFITLEIKGQSFMLHQIRKMVALVIGMVRNIATEESFEQAFKAKRIDLPIAPSLGLVLNQIHYDNYNERYGADGIHEKLDWLECKEEINTFKKNYIFKDIVDMEVAEKITLNWLATLALHTYSFREKHLNE